MLTSPIPLPEPGQMLCTEKSLAEAFKSQVRMLLLPADLVNNDRRSENQHDYGSVKGDFSVVAGRLFSNLVLRRSLTPPISNLTELWFPLATLTTTPLLIKVALRV